MADEKKQITTIGKKIELMSQEIGAMDKEGENKFDNYVYITYEQLDTKLRKLLTKYDLSILPEINDYIETPIMTSGNKPAIRTVVKMNFHITDTKTGETITLKWIGADQDTKGKSMPQATTECVKRFYLKTFKISSKDDTDPDSKSVENDHVIYDGDGNIDTKATEMANTIGNVKPVKKLLRDQIKYIMGKLGMGKTEFNENVMDIEKVDIETLSQNKLAEIKTSLWNHYANEIKLTKVVEDENKK